MTVNPNALFAEEERLAEEVYDDLIRPDLRPEDDGKYVAVAFEADDFKIVSDDYAATARLLARQARCTGMADANRRGRRTPPSGHRFRVAAGGSGD